MVTMADVASAANVSVTTVSHVLNGTRPVNQETADRVRAAIATIGYRMDPIARALRTSRTSSIGVVVSDTGHPIFADMIHGIDEVSAANGLSMLLTHSAEQPEREAQAVELLRERRVDGLLIVPSTTSDGDVIAAAVEDGLPVVAIDRPVDVAVDHVAADAEPAIAALTRHLVEVHGHRRIGVVAGTTANRANIARLEACEEELQSLGVDLDPKAVVTIDGLLPPVEAVSAAVADLLSSRSRPTALVSLNADMTVATIGAAQRLGLRIPDDLALVALDDLPWADFVEPKVTCAAQPARDMGRQAMHLLLERMRDADRPVEQRRLKCVIHMRRSCGCTI